MLDTALYEYRTISPIDDGMGEAKREDEEDGRMSQPKMTLSIVVTSA